jgi:PAS domain S-box-containing protein
MAASILFAGCVFIVMACGSIYSISNMNTGAGWVAHSEEVKAQVNGIFALVEGWESALQGYIISGNDDFFAPYANAQGELNERETKLQGLLSDNPEQLAREQHLVQLLQSKIASMNEAGDARRKSGYEAAAAYVTQGDGKRVMDEIRVLVTQMRGAEDELLVQRQLANDQQVRLSIGAALATSVVGLAVLGASGWLIMRQLRARRTAEEELAIKSGELQGIVDNAPQGIFLKDKQSRYLLVNAPMGNLLGVKPADCLGKLPQDLFTPERVETVLREDRKVLVDGKTEELDYEAVGVDGVRRTYRTLKFPLRDRQGQIYALGGLSQDITERNRMEIELREAFARAEAASTTKSQFLANMSHELRTPLNSIIGFSEILADKLFGALNEKQQQYVGNIQMSGRHLLLLINDLLDLAKIEAGKMHLDEERTMVSSLVRESAILARGLAERKGVVLEVGPVNSGLAARLDPVRAKQIIYNMLSNAVKFTPKGGRVTLQAEKVVEPKCPERGGPTGATPGAPLPGDWLRLTVTDTGIGIAAEDLERIFGEFEQVDSTYARQQEGTGLGLALTRKLAQLHGGGIWAESQGAVKRGSTFVVLLPIAGLPAEAEPPSAPVKPVKIDVKKLTPITRNGAAPTNARPLVLVVEDDMHACHLLCEHLTAGGYDTAHAGTGEEALQMAGNLRPAAITLDIMLPDANGMDVLARLKATQATSDIPVLIVSVTDERPLGLSLGASEFFVKPVSAEKLLTALARVRAETKKEIMDVLVVDDEAEARESIVAVLTPRGFNVRTTGSGEEALRMVAEKLPDVAIVDLTMPGMSGFELVGKLRENPATRNLPICIYTAKDLSAAELRWLHGQSATAITPKPFREQLLNELERVCAGST